MCVCVWQLASVVLGTLALAACLQKSYCRGITQRGRGPEVGWLSVVLGVLGACGVVGEVGVCRIMSTGVA